MARLGKLLILSIFLSMVSTSSFAREVRMGTLIGYGQSDAKDTGTYREAPLGTEFFIDFNIIKNFVLGGKHTRTIGGELGTSSSTSMLNLKYYFNSNFHETSAHCNCGDGESVEPTLKQTDYSFYLGLSLGFAQNSVRPSASGNSASTSGIALGAILGVDYNISKNYGARLQGSFDSSIVGIGHLQVLVVGLGLYRKF